MHCVSSMQRPPNMVAGLRELARDVRLRERERAREPLVQQHHEAVAAHGRAAGAEPPDVRRRQVHIILRRSASELRSVNGAR